MITTIEAAIATAIDSGLVTTEQIDQEHARAFNRGVLITDAEAREYAARRAAPHLFESNAAQDCPQNAVAFDVSTIPPFTPCPDA